MISLLGKLLLSCALFFAFIQGSLPLLGYYRKNPYLLATARVSALAQFTFLAGAYLLLTYAFVISDFSIAYVATNSHISLPLIYKLTAVWGSHEGSILLWILVLNIWTLSFIVLQKNNPNLTLTLSVLGILSFSFTAFLLFTSNPFTKANTLTHGFDLNPLLQDPGFVIHPPMLYMGYVGFSLTFAITQAALLRNQLDQAWAHLTKQCAIAAWCFLTLGILLGSWWAYRVLGWGGFWFWDPVENASLLPWLSGTALIHTLIIVEKRASAKSWATLLAIITFSLSLLATFLVRSGVLISVHSFSNDPARGVFLLFLLALLVGIALTLYLLRLPYLETSKTQQLSLAGKEMSLLCNSALLFIAMLTVLLGTLYPLILDALHLSPISVGAPYFNTVMAPLVFIIMAIMGFAPFTRWQANTWPSLWQQMRLKITLSLIISAALLFYFTHSLNVSSMLSLSLSLWIILTTLPYLKQIPGMSLAHLGFAILILGIMLSSLLSQEAEVKLKPGQVSHLGSYEFFFVQTKSIEGSNYKGIQAEFAVNKQGRPITKLYPEKRIYTVRDALITKVDIHPSIFRDLYIALGQPLDKDEWSIRIYYKPFIRWIWFGGLIMIAGGILAIRQKKQG